MTTKEVLNTLTHEEGLDFLNTKKNENELYDYLVKKGLTDDFDTFKKEAKQFVKDKMAKMSKKEIVSQIEGTELSDEQLAQIAGGKGDRVDSSDPHYGEQQAEVLGYLYAALL